MKKPPKGGLLVCFSQQVRFSRELLISLGLGKFTKRKTLVNLEQSYQWILSTNPRLTKTKNLLQTFYKVMK